jgi:hypothetical protein
MDPPLLPPFQTLEDKGERDATVEFDQRCERVLERSRWRFGEVSNVFEILGLMW